MKQEDLKIIQSNAGLVADVRSMIEQTREVVAHTVNAGMTLLYCALASASRRKFLGMSVQNTGKRLCNH